MLLIGRSLPGPNGKPQPLRRRHLLDEGSFYFQPNLHDAGPKVILGQSFPSGHGLDEGERLLDLLCKQPATARFLARKLAVRFVGDHPDEHLVARLADSFIKSGGNLTEEYETLVESPELWAPAARRAKVKTAFEYVVSSIRALAGEPDRRLRDPRGKPGALGAGGSAGQGEDAFEYVVSSIRALGGELGQLGQHRDPDQLRVRAGDQPAARNGAPGHEDQKLETRLR